ncbi:MAG: AAA family ATPase [Lewinellaceae bacterium]|nr:AAA family ATPase [Saprospiraceae bacterium]MCB9341914.1 AAA family ATPase [Lewinellaceae bacterium]
MVIGITNLKGGVGKSTISQNLAVSLAHKGYKVCVLDTDLGQRSSMKWAAQRGEDVPAIPVLGTEADNVIKDAKEQENYYDFVLIDGSPQLELAQVKTLTVSDIVIVPVSPSALDIWSMQQFMAKYEQVKAVKGDSIQGLILLNKFSGRMRLDREVTEALDSLGLKVMTTKLADRVVYREAPINGLGVLEMKNDKAKKEVTQLANEILKIVKKKK